MGTAVVWSRIDCDSFVGTAARMGAGGIVSTPRPWMIPGQDAVELLNIGEDVTDVGGVDALAETGDSLLM